MILPDPECKSAGKRLQIACGDVAHPVVAQTIAPGPAPCFVQRRERLSRTQSGDCRLSARRRLEQGGAVAAHLPLDCPCIMRREEAIGERHVRKVAAKGVVTRVELGRRAG